MYSCTRSTLTSSPFLTQRKDLGKGLVQALRKLAGLT